MPAKAQTDAHRHLAAARDAAREGNAELARQCLKRANAAYPVTRRQRAAVQTLLDKADKRK